ncbi:MAG: DUF4159 domain-containing protein [Planctomycetota bacterium]
MRRITFFLFAAISALLSVDATGQSNTLTHEAVVEKIERLKEHIYNQQSSEGLWHHAGHHPKGAKDPDEFKNIGGPTALNTLALLVSGESMQEPRLRRSIDWLRENDMHGTYGVALRAHVWSYLPEEFMGQLESDAANLLRSTGNRSRFNYWVYPNRRVTSGDEFRTEGRLGRVIMRIDNSTTQYGVLAIWQAVKRGARVRKAFWENAVDHFLDEQLEGVVNIEGRRTNVDGAWAYGKKGGGSGEPRKTMTCAGLTVLYIAQQQLFRDRDTPEPNITAAIQRGIDYLDRNGPVTSDGRGGGHGGGGYYYYGIERVALASGKRRFSGEDWFEAIAGRLVNSNAGRGPVEAAFALMFLSRGNVPLWINKLQLPGYDWNNRPNDLYFLNQYMSEYRESDLGWSVVPIDSDWQDWISTPILYLSGREPLELNDAQVAKIKAYIDHGGMLLANPEKNSNAFIKSIEELAQRMYPELGRMRPLGADHPLMSLIMPVTPSARTRVMSLSNGARDLIVMPRTDWGMQWQADETPGGDPPWAFAVNLYATASERGVMRPRLESPLVNRKARPRTGAVTVVRARLGGNDAPLIEPQAMTAYKNQLFNQTGLDLTVRTMPLAAIGDSKAELLHLAGVERAELTAAEVSAIKKFVENGGTVFVETLGGRGPFVDSMEEAIAEALGERVRRMSSRSPITRGRDLPGAEPIRSVVMRPASVLERGKQRSLSMTVIQVDRRDAVIFSRQDVSLGLMGARWWGINGYATPTASRFMSNLLAFARQQRSN